MTHVPHELAEEFPEQAQLVRDLRQTDARFARLADEYHQINKTLHRVETNIEPMCDIEALRLRKSRIALKDQIARLLAEAMPA
ncbi:MAG: YdcH family protein [Mangrovicoccus sp.]